ncbi:MAG: MFS transporter [Acidothermaceae bacterium]
MSDVRHPGSAIKATYSQIFRVREFSAVFTAHVVSMLGNIVADVALTVLVYQRTHSPALAASTMTLLFLPYLLGGSFLSSAAARWRTRRTLVTCDIASAVIVAVMATPRLPVAVILGLLFVLGLIAPIFQGVRAAILPQILPPGPQYVLGRSVLRLVAQGSQVAGFAIGGLLLVAVSPRVALVVDAGSFVLSSMVLRFGTKERHPLVVSAQRSVVHESMSSLKTVLVHRRLRKVMLIEWLVPLCAVAPEALAAPYVSHLHMRSNAVGFWLTAIPVGTVIGDIVAARLLPVVWQRRVAIPAMCLAGGSMLIFAVAPMFSVAYGLLIVIGLGAAYQPAVDQEVVDAAPIELQAAALSINSSGLMFFQGVGFGLWGLVGEVVSPAAVVVIAGVSLLVAVVFFHPWPLRRPHAAARLDATPA